MPNFAAFALSCSLPDEPNPSDTVRMATLLIFFLFRCSKILATASPSFCAVLNTHFFTGSVILLPAAQEISGICSFSATGRTAIDSPVVLGPIIATTLSSLIRRFAAWTALVASPVVSYTTSSSFFPLTPPLALISSTTILAVFLSGSPRKEGGPETEKSAPILMVAGAAKHELAQQIAAAEIQAVERKRFIISPYLAIAQSPLTILTISKAFRSRPL